MNIQMWNREIYAIKVGLSWDQQSIMFNGNSEIANTVTHPLSYQQSPNQS
jgi:hypothetical protein